MSKKTTSNILIAFILNLLFSIIELIGGLFTNSISIISDSFHDFGDAISIGISYVLEKKSKKDPDSKYSYGYLRYSVLGAFITSMILLLGSIVVLYNAIPRLFNPQVVNYDGMIILAIIGVIINGIASLKTAHSDNVNEKGVSLHMLEDVLGWIAVLIGSIVIKLFGLYIIDPILSIGITIYILFHIIQNMREISSIFLEKVPNKFDITKIQELIASENIKDSHHIHVWSLDGINNYLTMHIVLNKDVTNDELIRIKHEIKHKLEHIEIHHSTIEFEYDGEDCESRNCSVPETDTSHHHHHHHH